MPGGSVSCVVVYGFLLSLGRKNKRGKETLSQIVRLPPLQNVSEAVRFFR